MSKPFTLPKEVTRTRRRRATVSPKPDNIDPKIPRFSVEGLFIKGKAVGSVLEWNIAAAFDILELDYDYQVSVFGGRIRGGAVIDFLVYTKPTAVYIWAQGDYWHSRGTQEDEDQFTMDRVEATYNRKSIPIWEHEALTVEMAVLTLKKKLRV